MENRKFTVGQKVICVVDDTHHEWGPHGETPNYGPRYLEKTTVAAVEIKDEETCLEMREYPMRDEDNETCGFNSACFLTANDF